MKTSRILLTVPTILIPYMVLFSMATIFFSSKIDFFDTIMKSIFDDNGLLLLFSLFVYCIVASILNIVSFILNKRNNDALILTRYALIVKLIQIPAYIVIFLLGVLLLFSLFTIPFTIMMFLINCLTLLLTGLITISAVKSSVRLGLFTNKSVIWIKILQFFFVADIISLILFYVKLKGKIKNK